MSFRGRGRGRGQVRTGSPEADSESSRSTPTPAPPEAGPSSSRAGSVAPGTNGHHTQQPQTPAASSSSSTVANLLRKNDYTKKSNTPAMKFMPNMARRKQPGKIDLSVVKKEADERPPSQLKKPAGRGRGKPMMAEMTASGTFAMGPSQGLKKAAVSGGASFGGGGGGGGGSGVSRSKDDGDNDGAAYDSSDEDDDWEPSRAASAQVDAKPPNGRSADLSEIDKEDDMAPLVLPRDQGNVMGETEQNMLAKDEAQATLPPPPSIMPQVKDEPADEEELKSQLSTPAPESSTKASSLAPPEGDDQKKPTIVKSEHVADGFMQDQAAAAVEQLYVFQFPRVFPHFNPAPKPQPPANGSHGSSAPMDVDGSKEEAKPDVKPTIRKPVSGYVPGQWQGWGKAAGREGRDMTDLNFEGQVGKLRVHASGKVSLVLGSGKDKLRYDILPAAPASFLQEVAVQIPKTMERPDGEPPLQQGLYVMGQTDKKYVVRPNISQLLQGLNLKKEEAKVVPAKKEAEDPSASLPQKGTGSVGDLLARPKPAAASAGRGRAAPARGTGATRPTGARGRGRG